MTWFTKLFGDKSPLIINIHATIIVRGECPCPQPVPPAGGPPAPTVSVGKGDSRMKIVYPFGITTTAQDATEAKLVFKENGGDEQTVTTTTRDETKPERPFVGSFEVEEGSSVAYKGAVKDAKNYGPFNEESTIASATDDTPPPAPGVTVGSGDTAAVPSGLIVGKGVKKS